MTRRIPSVSFVVLALAGILVTGWGLGHMAWPETLFDEAGLFPYLPIFLVFALLVAAGTVWLRRNSIVVGCVISIGVAILAGALWPLVVALWFGLASAIVGKSLLSFLRVHQGDGDWVFEFMVGAGVYGSAVGLLAHLPASYPGVYGLALAAPLILGRATLVELGVALRPLLSRKHNPTIRVNGLDVAIAVVGLVHLAIALMPEVGHDALAMHLFIPAHMALRQQWGFDVSKYVWAVMPMLGDWIFTIGYMLAGETAARLINLGFIFVLAWLVRDLVLWAGGKASGARWASLIFLSTPLTLTVSSSLFIDSIWAAFVVAGTLALLRTRPASSTGRPYIELPIAGFLLGCALAAKAVSLTVLPALLPLLIGRQKMWLGAGAFRRLLIGLTLFLALGLIPYLTAYWITGNPVFPFFNRYFPSPHDFIAHFKVPSLYGKGLSWDLPYQVTFHSNAYLESQSVGAIGFQWLLLLLPAAALAVLTRQRRVLILFLIGTLGVAVTFEVTAYLRYILPSLVVLAAAMCASFAEADSSPRLLRRCFYVIGSLVVGLNLLFFNSATSYGSFDVLPLSGAAGRDAYLQSRLPIRNAVEIVNRLNRGRTPVAVFSSYPLTAGLAADGLYTNWYDHRFESLVTAAETESELAEVMLNNSVDFAILDANWATAEKRAQVEKTTDEIYGLGTISVRALAKKYRFRTQLLKNADFSTAEGWSLTAGRIPSPNDEIVVSVASPASQVVPVTAGRRYLNTVKARCNDQPTQGRLQVNWLGPHSEFINTDIVTFDCSVALAEHTMAVVAPPGAALAVVYASGHTAIPIVFKEDSFRQ